jgi:hypothetical protein
MQTPQTEVTLETLRIRRPVPIRHYSFDKKAGLPLREGRPQSHQLITQEPKCILVSDPTDQFVSDGTLQLLPPLVNGLM